MTIPEPLEGPETASLLSTDDDRLARILDEYLVAVERGDPIAPEQLLERYPQDAARLQDYLSGLNLFHAAAGVALRGSRSQAFSSAPERAGQTIGDFRLLAEIGRGGMGVVYEAYQISLRRRVALKVLPFTSAHDAKHIGRFKNEAQAAAQVQHPNIVPVFAVGEEAGIHYYAMQLIDGQSLISMLGRLRGNAETTSVGTTAPIFTSAPRRQNCVPTNLLALSRSPAVDDTRMDANRTAHHVRSIAELGIQAAEALHAAHEYGVVHRDIKPSNLLVENEGKLWVTDFGLARFRDNSDLTRTGDIMGTMRYMSPEQSLGRSELVDHRTDIYSLGLTLYELATLHYPADGLVDTRLFWDRSRVAGKRLRHWNQHVPADFETIVQKSIAEFPHERYATARDFANDLRRFVEGKPIVASPPTAITRAGKWAKRHRGTVYAAAAIVLVAFAGLAASLVVKARGNMETERALAQAQQNLQEVRTVLDQFGTQLPEQLAAIPGAEGVRQQVLNDSLDVYRRFEREAASDPTLLADQALAQTKIGDLSAKLGDQRQAAESLESAVHILERLVVSEPTNREYARNLALSYNKLAMLVANAGGSTDAIDLLKKAQAIQERLLAADSKSFELATNLATTLGNLGLVLGQSGAKTEASIRLRDAIEIGESVVNSTPDDENVLRSLAASYSNLGSLQDAADSVVAKTSFTRAIEIQRELVVAHRLNRVYQSDLAQSFNNLGFIESRAKDWSGAERCYADAIRLQENLVKMSPLAATYRRDLAVSYNNLGMAQTQSGRASDAELSFREALRLQRELLGTSPNDVQTLSNLGGIANNVAMLLERQNRAEAAGSAYREAIDFQRRAIDAAPKNDAIRDLLSKHYYNYAKLLRQQGKPDAAGNMALERRKLWSGNPDRLYSVAQELVEVCRHWGELSPADKTLQTTYADAAMATLREAVAAGLPVERLNDASFSLLAGRQEFRDLASKTDEQTSRPVGSQSQPNALN